MKLQQRWTAGLVPARISHRCRSALRQSVKCASNALPIPSQYSKLSPKGDLILAKVANVEEQTTGGILLPSSAQKRPTSGDVVALGDGRLGEGATRPFTLKVGDTIVYSKFGIGVTELDIQGGLFALLKEDDVIGIMPNSSATAADVEKIKPIGDRVLLKVEESSEVTVGGVLLPDSAKERPMMGTVVAVGEGKFDPEKKERKTPKVSVGDKVLYFKFAGDAMETPDGVKYTVVHDNDILCKTT